MMKRAYITQKKRVLVEMCMQCPFFDDGACFEYLSYCRAVDMTGVDDRGKEVKNPNKIQSWCPLDDYPDEEQGDSDEDYERLAWWNSWHKEEVKEE